MLAPLDRLCGASRADVLPGYVLREPRLRELGAVESELNRQHLADVAEVYADAPDLDAQIDAAWARCHAGRFQYGSPHFNALARDRADNLLMLVHACLWSYQIPQAGVAALVDAAPDPAAVINAALALWGFERAWRKSDGAWQPMDYRGMFRALRKRGFTREEVANLTLSQALNELGADDDSLSEDAAREILLKRADAWMDKACAHLNTTPDMLHTFPPETVAEAGHASGGKRVSPNRIPKLIRDYQQRKGCAHG